MMNDNEILATIRQRIGIDASGEAVGDFIIELKAAGLQKADAKRLLTVVMLECRELNQDPLAETKEEGIAAVLDRVTGWCSHRHIFPR
jgi:hypothetical protein